MKTRLGFVSNSSSSSFIYYPEHPEEIIKPKRQLGWAYDPVGLPEKIIGKKGFKRFGWGPDELHDSESKINWCFMQAFYSRNEDLLERVALVIEDYESCIISNLNELFELEKPNVPYKFNSIFFREKKYYEDYSGLKAHIDHQSSYPKNSEMLESTDKIRTFIYGEAFIVLRNDNEYGDYYSYEGECE